MGPSPPSTPSTILVVTDDRDNAERLRILLESEGFRVALAHTRENAYDAVYVDPPQVVIVDWALAGTGRQSLLLELKSDNVYGHLPVILMAPESTIREGIDWTVNPADDYIVKPEYVPRKAESAPPDSPPQQSVADIDMLSRIRLCMARAHRDVNANPLTGLPGNITLMREAERYLAADIPFAMGHLDIDNFKPFNDAYGFNRGDEVIRMTARIVVNAIRALDDTNAHVGHIGGDDFVFLVPPEYTIRTCERIIRDFGCIVPNFYDEKDREAAQIESVDRKGNVQTFPLMTISLAVVDTSTVEIAHLADLSARAAEVKHFAKQLVGSNYIVDRRK